MKKFIGSGDSFTHTLIFGMLATSGLRISELLKLRKEVISRRVLTLRYLKSGLKEEKAVIPQKLASKLKFYMRNHAEGMPKFYQFLHQVNALGFLLDVRCSNANRYERYPERTETVGTDRSLVPAARA
jgi:integrase